MKRQRKFLLTLCLLLCSLSLSVVAVSAARTWPELYIRQFSVRDDGAVSTSTIFDIGLDYKFANAPDTVQVTLLGSTSPDCLSNLWLADYISAPFITSPNSMDGILTTTLQPTLLTDAIKGISVEAVLLENGTRSVLRGNNGNNPPVCVPVADAQAGSSSPPPITNQSPLSLNWITPPNGSQLTANTNVQLEAHYEFLAELGTLSFGLVGYTTPNCNGDFDRYVSDIASFDPDTLAGNQMATLSPTYLNASIQSVSIEMRLEEGAQSHQSIGGNQDQPWCAGANGTVVEGPIGGPPAGMEFPITYNWIDPGDGGVISADGTVNLELHYQFKNAPGEITATLIGFPQTGCAEGPSILSAPYASNRFSASPSDMTGDMVTSLTLDPALGDFQSVSIEMTLSAPGQFSNSRGGNGPFDTWCMDIIDITQ